MKRHKELYDALECGYFNDFISSEGYRFSKDELITIIKNLDFAVYQLMHGNHAYEIQLLNNLADEEFFED